MARAGKLAWRGQQSAVAAFTSTSSEGKRQPRLVRQRRECRVASAAKRSPKTLLWIDDYEPGLNLYKYMFEALGFQVLTASRGAVGLEMLKSQPVDAVVTDYEMPEMNGEAVASSVKKMQPTMPVVMFTGSSCLPARVKGLVDAVCDKAGSRDALLSAIQGVLVGKSAPVSATPVYAA